MDNTTLIGNTQYRQKAACQLAKVHGFTLCSKKVVKALVLRYVYHNYETGDWLFFIVEGNYLPEYFMQRALNLHRANKDIDPIFLYVQASDFDIREFHAHGHFGGNDAMCSHEYEGVANGEPITVALYNYTNEEAGAYIADLGLMEVVDTWYHNI